MGDMILTAPLFAALKQHFPRARLSVLASPANAQVAAHCPAVDAVVVDAVEARHSGWRGIIALSRRLRQLNIDVILFANAKHRMALAAWLARIPVRIGSARRGYSLLYSARVAAADTGHETDRVLRLLEPLGVAPSIAQSHWRVADAEACAVDGVLAAAQVPAGGRIAAIHPSNSGNALTGSPEWYAQLGDTLVSNGYAVVLTGTGEDRPLVRAILQRMRQPAFDLTGRFSIPELAALYARCAVCIASSTGPAHLAAVVGAPTIGLYAPLVQQERWVPRGPAVRILRPPIEMRCARCRGPRCEFFNCLNLIAPERIVAVAAELQADREGRSTPSEERH